MTDYLRSHLRLASPYKPGEQWEGPYIKLNTNECPYPPSSGVIKAIQAATPALGRYPQPDADAARDALASTLGVKPDQVLVGNGSDEILRLIFEAYIDPAEVVVWSTPTYSLYTVLAEIAQAIVYDVPRNDDFTLDVDAVLAQDAKIYFLANPNSPTGTVTSEDDVKRLLSSGRLIVVDEAYADFEGTTTAKLIDEFSNLIVVRTLSKSYALAGLRAGFAIANSDIISELRGIKDSYNVGLLPIVGAAAALADQSYAKELVVKVLKTKTVLVDGLGALGWECYPSGANFVFAEPPNRDGKLVYEFLRESGILVRWFDGDTSISAGVRITVGTDEEIAKLLEVLKSYGE